MPEPTYTVQPGDTLWSIAARHLGAGDLWPRLWEANRASIEARQSWRYKGPDWIFPGTVLKVPGER